MVMGISGCSSNVQDDSKQKIVSIQKMDKSFKSEKREKKLDTLSIPLSEVHAICYRSPHNPLKKSIFFKS